MKQAKRRDRGDGRGSADRSRADRGSVRNPWTTVLNQYRPHFRALAAELGLTTFLGVADRAAGGRDEDDPFD